MPILETLALKTVFGGVKRSIGGALSWIADHPWQTATIALAALYAWAQVFTIPGIEKARDAEIAAHKQTKATYLAAQVEAGKLAEKARQKQVERYAKIAKDADNEITRAKSDAISIADRYIAANRVRCQAGTATGSSPGGTVATAGNSGAGLPEGAGGDAELVAVQPNDVRVCTANTIKLDAAQDWALGLERASHQ